VPEVVPDWFGRLVVKKVKDRIESIAGGKGSIAWCGGLLWVQIVVKLLRSLDPFSFLTLRRWDNLWCDGLYHYRGTCNNEDKLYTGLGHDRDPGSLILPFGCIDYISG
jgi:hypothetical protein